jgi:ribosomal protein S27E
MDKHRNEAAGWGPRRLPILHVDGRAYFIDLRLQELRATDNPHVRIDLRTSHGRAAAAGWKAVPCPTCGQPSVVRRDDPAESRPCPRCGQALVLQGGEAVVRSAPGHADRPS